MVSHKSHCSTSNAKETELSTVVKDSVTCLHLDLKPNTSETEHLRWDVSHFTMTRLGVVVLTPALKCCEPMQQVRSGDNYRTWCPKNLPSFGGAYNESVPPDAATILAKNKLFHDWSEILRLPEQHGGRTTSFIVQ